MRAFLQNPPSIRIGGSLTKSLYQYTLMSGDTPVLYKSAIDMEKEMAQIPGLQDVTSDLQIKSPELHVVIDRDRAAALRVTPDQIEGADEGPNYEQREHIALAEAVTWAMQFSAPVTLYIYDEDGGIYLAKEWPQTP